MGDERVPAGEAPAGTSPAARPPRTPAPPAVPPSGLPPPVRPASGHTPPAPSRGGPPATATGCASLTRPQAAQASRHCSHGAGAASKIVSDAEVVAVGGW